MGGKKGKGGWQENGKERNEWGMECFEWQTSRYDTSSVTLSNLKKKKNKNTDTEIRESDDKGSIERDIRFYFFFFFSTFGIVPRRCGTNIRALPIFRPPNATSVLLSTIHYGLIISYSHMELKRASLSHYLRIARLKMNNLYLSLSLVVFE